MKRTKLGVWVIVLLALMVFTKEAVALPMFSTQTGLDCRGCHLQTLPKLNKTGRMFAITGMTLSQNIKDSNGKLMEEDHPKSDINCKECHVRGMSKFSEEGKKVVALKRAEKQKQLDLNSSSIDINPSLMFKSMYEETWDKPGRAGSVSDSDTEDGEYSIPRVVSLYIGGRLSENFGVLANFAYRKIDKESITGKVLYSKKIDDGYFGSVLYSSSNFGPFSGMEIYNTGLYKPLRSFDIRKYSNALQMSGIGSGAATGLQVYYDKDYVLNDFDHFFATFGLYAPGQDNLYMNLSKNLLPMARITYEYPIGEFNIVFGGFGIAGDGSSNSMDSLKIERESYGLDLQVEGTLFDKDVHFIASKVLKNEVTITGTNVGIISDLENRDNEAFSIEGVVDLTHNLSAKFAYLTYDDLYDYPEYGVDNNRIDALDIDNAVTIGFNYNFQFYTSMQVGVEHSWIKPGLDRVKDFRNFLVTFNILF